MLDIAILGPDAGARMGWTNRCCRCCCCHHLLQAGLGSYLAVPLQIAVLAHCCNKMLQWGRWGNRLAKLSGARLLHTHRPGAYSVLASCCWQCRCRQGEARRASEDARASAARTRTEMAALRTQIRALEQEVTEAKGQAADAQARAQVAEAAAAKR